MTRNIRTGIFIQGPIISKGRTGRSLTSDPLTPGPISELKSFNCVDNINNAHTIYSKFFDEVIIIIWESDLEYLPYLDIPSSSIAVLPDIKANGVQNQYITFQNSNRQYLSSLTAIEILKNRNCDMIIKTRSDQQLDARTLFENLTNSENSGLLLFPYRDESNFDLMNDFYIGGSTHNLYAIFNSLVSEPPFSKNVHFDIYYKCFRYFQSSNTLKLRNHQIPNFFDTFARPLISKFAYGELAELLIAEDKKWLGTFDQEIWKSLHWRGELVVQEASEPREETSRLKESWKWFKRLLVKTLMCQF